MADFLISAHEADQARADWVASVLTEAGYEVVCHTTGLAHPADFAGSMRQAATMADRIVVLLSPAYLGIVGSPAVWKDAFPQDPTGEERMVLPVRIADCDVEGALGTVTYLDLVGLGADDARRALADIAGLARGRFRAARMAPPEERSAAPDEAAPTTGSSASFPDGPPVFAPGPTSVARDLVPSAPGPQPPPGVEATGRGGEQMRAVQTRAGGSFPPVVTPGSVHELRFEIGEKAGGDASIPVETLVHASARALDLTVVVQASHFDIVGADHETPADGTARVSLALDAPGAIEKGSFFLKAENTAERLPSVIRLRILHDNNPIGVIRIPTTIDPGDVSETPEPEPVSGKVTYSSNAPAGPELLLIVNRDDDDTFEITATLNAGLGGSIPRAKLGSFPVTGEAWEYASSILEAFRGVEHLPQSERLDRVDNLGLDLWRKLPTELHDFYWKNVHDNVETILICSEEPYIPWELVKPERSRGGETGRMLGEAFAMARWDDERKIPNPIEVGDFVVIAPDYASNALPWAAREADELLSTFGARRIEPGNRSQVMGLFKSTDVQVLHFSGHGEFERTPDDTRIALADTPLDIIDVNSALFLQSAEPPLIFWNACEVGASGWSLTQIGGWAEAFCAAGSAAFVGPYWAINDRVAYKASMIFYRSLQRGMTIGTAMQEIRDQFYLDPEDRYHPSWLAYTLHCHPNVTVQL